MKICFLSSMHPPEDKRVFDKEAVYLARHGFDVIHFAPGDGTSRVREGVKIITYQAKNGISGRLWQLVNLYRSARSINADVYHCNEVDSWIIGVILRLRRGALCVFDVHEHYPEDFAEMRFPVWFRPPVEMFIRILMWSLSKFTDRIVLAKSSLIRSFESFPAHHLVLAQNFTPLSALESNSFSGIKEYSGEHFNDRPLRLIHLGLFNKSRGLFQMLESIKGKDRIELLFLGQYSDGSESELQTVIEQYGLSDRVKYKAWVPFEEALKYVRESDIGLIMFQPGYFNHVHALPHKLFDYMAAGIPVIAPDFAIEVSEVVSDAGCGVLVDSSDANALSCTIDWFIENPEAIEVMGKKGASAIKNKYHWEVEGDKLVEMYTNLERLCKSRD